MKSRFATSLPIWTLMLASICSSAPAAEYELSALNRQIPDFTLTDYRGKTVSLSDYQAHQIVVVAFTGTECPLAKLYGPRLQTLHERYRDRNVVFIAVNSNRQDTLTEIAAWSRRQNISFPVLKDSGSTVANLFSAIRTPEVYVLDAERKVRYQGRIDDQYDIGIVRNQADQTWLADAIDALLAGKSPDVNTVEAVGCHIGRVKQPNPDSPVTYTNQVARIFRDHCVECHRDGEIGPFTLTSYEDSLGWAEMIREVVNDKRMPPWHASPDFGKFENDCSLTTEQIAQIDLWVRNGAPEGDPAELPEPRTFVKDWQLPRLPDREFTMRDTPFKVAAEGEIKYQNFTIDPGFTEDMYVSAAEIVPGNRAVVHHILVAVRPPDNRFKIGAGGGEFLAAYVPGARFKPLPEGMAKLIPKGSKIHFQVHYTPIGTEQEDQSKIGLVFAKPEDVTDVVITWNAVPRWNNGDMEDRNPIKIPPFASNHRIEAQPRQIPAQVKLLGLLPHMHLRGKSFKYTLLKPDGSREVLLDVPKYDFNWQTTYRLAEPETIPAGSQIECVAHYDNSEQNPANPAPEATVRWGDQTDDEMMIGYFDIAVDRNLVVTGEGSPTVADGPQDNTARNEDTDLFKRLDKNNDGVIIREEVRPNLHKHFKDYDENQDGKVTEEEFLARRRRQ